MEPTAPTEREQAIEILEPLPVVTDATLRITATRIMLGLFAFSVAATFGIIFGYGRGYLKYPEWFLKWLERPRLERLLRFWATSSSICSRKPLKTKGKNRLTEGPWKLDYTHVVMTL